MTNSGFEGHLLDGLSAKTIPIVVQLTEAGLVVKEAEGAGRLWVFKDYSVSELSTTQVRLTDPEFMGVEVIVDSDEFMSLLVKYEKLQDRYHPNIKLLALCGSLVAAIVFFVVTIDPLSKAIAKRFPPSMESSMRTSVKTMFKEKQCQSDDGHNALKKMATKLKLPKDAFDVDILMIQEPRPNAFALPGGVIVFTSGLLQDAKSADELAGILAHEMEHVEKRHVLTKLVRAAMTTGAWSVLTGDLTSIIAIDPGTLIGVATLKFDRDDEREADLGAIKRLDQANISRKGWKDFFERLAAKENSDLAMLSTHPLSSERAVLIETNSEKATSQKALSELDLELLKNACQTSVSEKK